MSSAALAWAREGFAVGHGTPRLEIDRPPLGDNVVEWDRLLTWEGLGLSGLEQAEGQARDALTLFAIP